MSKYAFLFLIVTSMISACTKPVKPVPDPQPGCVFSRTITYVNTGNIKTVSYAPSYKVQAQAIRQDNLIYLGFIAAPTTNASAGDGIAFCIDAAHLQNGLAKTYNLSAQAPVVISCRYSYTYRKDDGNSWSSFTDTGIGTIFEGTLVIDNYDAARKLISGSFNVLIKNLINDPTKNNTGSPIDPKDLCNVSVAGSFQHIKLVLN